MTDALLIIITVLGGLGLFLLGMKHLSEGLQATAGGGLRKFMAHATSHRIVGVGTGVISTMIVQSSSIITVMLVGFVSTALLTLPQAINVLIGANIGTTATVWIIAYAPNPQLVGFVGVALGGLLYFFLRGERVHNLGLTVIGLGLVFLGLYFMSKGVLPIRENPDIAGYFTSMDGSNLWGCAKVAFVSMLLTAVIQSSAATVAIAMTLASQQLITYEVAIAVLFGANVGTTATGWIAAIGGTADAKRTALAHTLSNLLGSIVLLPFLPLFVKAGQAIFPNWNLAETAIVSGAPTEVLTRITAPIAVTDTLFAVCRGALLFPFVTKFARLIERIIPQPENEKPHLSALRFGGKVSPVIACDQALQEIMFMKESNLELLSCVRQVVEGTGDEAVETHIVHREDVLDNVQREVTEFLGSMMTKRLGADVAERARLLLRLTDELESVSDEAATILKAVKRLRNDGQKISDVSAFLLLNIHERVAEFAAEVSGWIRSPRPYIDVKTVQSESKGIHEFIRTSRKTQIARVGQDDPGSAIRVLAELDIITAYDRTRSYYLNIAEAMSGGKR